MSKTLDRMLEKSKMTKEDLQRHLKNPKSKGLLKAPKRAVEDSAELRRILELPRRSWEAGAAEYVDILTKHLRTPQGQQKLRPIQAAALVEAHDWKGMIGSIRVGGGKCVCSGTEVFDASEGRRRLVEDLGSFHTVSMREGEGTLEVACAVSVQSGSKDCYRLTLANGMVLDASFDHPIYTGRGWVWLRDLAEDDLVATARSIPDPVRFTEASDDEVKLAALRCSNTGQRVPPSFWGLPKDQVRLLLSYLDLRVAESESLLSDIRFLRGRLAETGPSDLAWERIDKVEHLGEREVFDLSVPSHGNFVANGIVIHNTLISLLACLVLEAKRPVLLLPAKLIEKTKRESAALRKHWVIPGYVRLVSYELLGRANHAKLLEEMQPDLIVADECFIAGTGVLTPRGHLPIEHIEPGDEVIDENGRIQTVLDSWASIPQTYLYRVSTPNGSVVCTAKHPWKTERGWKNAEDLEAGDNLCVVSGAPREDERREVLQHQLQRLVENVATGNTGESPCKARREEDLEIFAENVCVSPGAGRVEVREDEGEEPNVGCVCKRSSKHPVARDRTQTEGTGRTGPSHAGGTEDSPQHARPRLGARGLLPDSWQRGPLEGGLVSPGHEDCRGGGRPEPYFFEGEGERRQEGCRPVFLRLVRVQSVERLSDHPNGRGARVYNLTVSGTSTYVVGPDNVVVHNCHKLKNTSAAVTRRVKRYLDLNPECAFIGMSGTITKRSLHDYAHLCQWALKKTNPTPATFPDRMAWAFALDEKTTQAAKQERLAPGRLVEFCTEEERAKYAQSDDYEEAVGVVRRAYRRRVTETPGFIASMDGELGVSLMIDSIHAPLPASVMEAIATMQRTWERPDGVEVIDAIELWRHMREIACGFYYRWNPEPPQEWRKARSAWAKFVREVLRTNRLGLDSESQVARAVDQGAYPGDILRVWREIRPTFTPQTEAVWLHDVAIKSVLKWAKESPGIVWVEHVELGKALRKVAGLSYYGKGGQDERGRPIEAHPPGTSMVASLSSNAEGRNLQAWSNNLMTSPPTSGATWEQILGRTHRDGQQAEEVTCTLLLSLPVQLEAFRRATLDAQYIQDTTGQAQKLAYADLAVEDPWGQEALVRKKKG